MDGNAVFVQKFDCWNTNQHGVYAYRPTRSREISDDSFKIDPIRRAAADTPVQAHVATSARWAKEKKRAELLHDQSAEIEDTMSSGPRDAAAELSDQVNAYLSNIPFWHC
jgi:hypothetical protein